MLYSKTYAKPKISIYDQYKKNNHKIFRMIISNEIDNISSVDNIDFNISDENGFKPLHLAIHLDRWKIVDILLEKGADPKVVSRRVGIKGGEDYNITTSPTINYMKLKDFITSSTSQKTKDVLEKHNIYI